MVEYFDLKTQAKIKKINCACRIVAIGLSPTLDNTPLDPRRHWPCLPWPPTWTSPWHSQGPPSMAPLSPRPPLSRRRDCNPSQFVKLFCFSPSISLDPLIVPSQGSLRNLHTKFGRSFNRIFEESTPPRGYLLRAGGIGTPLAYKLWI